MFSHQQYFCGLAETVAFFAKKLEDQTSEILWVAHLSSDLRCLKLVSYSGDNCSVTIPVRQVIRDVFELESAGIIFVHNHPSGVSKPSSADFKATATMCRLARDFDFTVLDHLVFAGKEWTSMRQVGLL